MANSKAKSKTTKKKRSIFSKINFGSTKTRIVITILVFGVIGGGFTVYKSFALSNAGVIGAAQLDGSPIKETVSSTGKANNSVARLAPGENIEWHASADTLANFNKLGIYRFCATVRYEAPSTASKPAKIYMSAYQMLGFPHTVSVIIVDNDQYTPESKTYTKQCTNQFRGWGRDAATFKLENGGPSTIRSGSFIIERLQ